MAVAAPLPPRSFRSPSPSSSLASSFARSPSPSSPRARASASPPLHHTSRAPRRPSIEPKDSSGSAHSMDSNKHVAAAAAAATANGHAGTNGSSAPERKREGSIGSIGSMSEDDEGVRRRRQPRSPASGVGTLPTIPAHVEMSPDAVFDATHAPPPAKSSGASTSSGTSTTVVIGSDGKPVVRRRRASSVKQKPPPGVKPVKVVDWEIPRKAFHSSIGFLTLGLYCMDPPSVRPLIQVLSIMCASIFAIDLVRLNWPAFAELWEVFAGFLMREEERNRINGVVWYLVGVVFVLSLYPRDVAVVAILTLSWSDTTASTIGRLWGRYTPPLPAHVPGIKWLPFAPRKSLAGFLAATVTGFCIGMGFWHSGSTIYHDWRVLDTGVIGRVVTAIVFGVGGAVVEALDLGVDDNLSLPILSGALIWAWLAGTNVLLGH